MSLFDRHVRLAGARAGSGAGGAIVVDKSAAYRLADGVPLVVPEVNGARAPEHEGIVANPNCCAIPLTCVLKPLHDAAGLRRIRVATYQSMSGAGASKMQQLEATTHDLDLLMEWDYDGEEFDENEAREETRKIIDSPSPRRAELRPRAGDGRPRRDRLDRDQVEAARTRRRHSSARRRASRSRTSRPGKAKGSDEVLVGRSARTRPRRTGSSSSSRATTCARAQR